ncbi:exosome complex protein LRP1 [Sporothrix schenckii 1099-18]|uniref:Exosome complex protein n=2 Tax=Sporothrix schenckii TaxID=29908 RepID=U7PWQ5_SPOS1|nr:exosome complex protein LRP1 [Sporothrix schenckii 1099-18]ERT00084.1 hypothetical protein HMPREF1624_03453 [Sporothrix schenckii ATCC 58251]KJR85480.1 exosome complex protein LRP1 [Sporothrix schenckii 1099-18]
MDDIQPRIRQLAADIDRLKAAVAPLLLNDASSSSSSTNSHAAAAMHLPLLDKAKLHVLASFALESTLYCSLGLAGVDARNHAVFRELQRVRQYMGKIDAAEKPPVAEPPTNRLNKSAAIRFLKADLDDSPGVRSQLDDLLKQEQAAAAAGTQSESAAARAAGNASPRGRKRGGGAAAGGGAGSSSGGGLTKRPKHGSGRDSPSSDARGRSHPYSRGSRAT